MATFLTGLEEAAILPTTTLAAARTMHPTTLAAGAVLSAAPAVAVSPT